MITPINLEEYKPTITDFKAKHLGNNQCIFITTVKELVLHEDNTPVIDAQIRALRAALLSLEARV